MLNQQLKLHQEKLKLNEADRVIIATRTRNNRNMIISLDDISTKKNDYDEYLELARFIQSEFIR